MASKSMICIRKPKFPPRRKTFLNGKRTITISQSSSHAAGKY